VTAVPQPHRYSRLASLFEEFCACFNDADLVAIADVYAAGEAPVPGVSRDALVGGLRAHQGLAGYDASKGAIDALTRSMAIDCGRYGIRVNAVAPGQIRQNVYRRLEAVPLNRVGTAEDVAAAVAFLASEAAAYITGQVLYVDGGLTAQLTPPGISI